MSLIINLPPHVKPKINKNNGVPAEFDWLAYISLNGLDKNKKTICSYIDAVKHYIGHGQFQSMKYKHDSVKPYNQTIQVHNNKINGVPNDFDWLFYKSHNLELAINSYNEAIEHYKNHGYRENRQYKNQQIEELIVPPNIIENIAIINNKIESEKIEHINEVTLPKDFNWTSYVLLNPDLKELIKNKSSAIRHYLEHGHRENRTYTSPNINIDKFISIKSVKLKPHMPIKIPEKPEKFKINIRKDVLIQPEPQKELAIPINNILNVIPTKFPIKLKVLENNQKIIPKITLKIHHEISPKINKIKVKLRPQVDKLTNQNKIISLNNENKFSFTKMPINYIFGLSDDINEREFTFSKYLSIYSSHLVYSSNNQIDCIYVHYHYTPTGYWWNKLIDDNIIIPHQINYDNIFKDHPQHLIKFKKCKHFSERTNIIKLFILKEYGGYYFDIDTIMLRPLIVDKQYDIILSKCEGSISGAFIFCQRQSTFINQWIHEINDKKNINTHKWDYIYNIIPKKILKSNNLLKILVLPSESYIHWEHTNLIFNKFDSDLMIKIQAGVYLHLWDSVYKQKLDELSVKSLTDNTIFNVICRKFLSNRDINCIKFENLQKIKTTFLVSTNDQYIQIYSELSDANIPVNLFMSENIGIYISHNKNVTFNRDLLLYDTINNIISQSGGNMMTLINDLSNGVKQINKCVYYNY